MRSEGSVSATEWEARANGRSSVTVPGEVSDYIAEVIELPLGEVILIELDDDDFKRYVTIKSQFIRASINAGHPLVVQRKGHTMALRLAIGDEVEQVFESEKQRLAKSREYVAKRAELEVGDKAKK